MAAAVKLDVRLTGAEPLLARLHALGDPRLLEGALDGVADDLAALTAQTFRDARDPWGQPWKPLRPSTIRARRKGPSSKGGVQILRDTGSLQNSISARRTSPTTVEIGTTHPLAAVHQLGANIQHAARSLRVRLRTNARGELLRRTGKDGKPTKLAIFAKDSHARYREVWGTNSTGWTVRIPARPFLPIRPGGADLPPSWTQAIGARLQRAIDQAAKG